MLLFKITCNINLVIFHDQILLKYNRIVCVKPGMITEIMKQSKVFDSSMKYLGK